MTKLYIYYFNYNSISSALFLVFHRIFSRLFISFVLFWSRGLVTFCWRGCCFTVRLWVFCSSLSSGYLTFLSSHHLSSLSCILSPAVLILTASSINLVSTFLCCLITLIVKIPFVSTSSGCSSAMCFVIWLFSGLYIASSWWFLLLSLMDLLVSPRYLTSLPFGWELPASGS